MATNEACKEVRALRLLMEDLHLADAAAPTSMFNDNRGCIDWSKSMSTKRLRHFNICKNAICDSISLLEINLSHVPGVCNPADIFTKEHRDMQHFDLLVSCFLTPFPSSPPWS